MVLKELMQHRSNPLDDLQGSVGNDVRNSFYLSDLDEAIESLERQQRAALSQAVPDLSRAANLGNQILASLRRAGRKDQIAIVLAKTEDLVDRCSDTEIRATFLNTRATIVAGPGRRGDLQAALADIDKGLEISNERHRNTYHVLLSGRSKLLRLFANQIRGDRDQELKNLLEAEFAASTAVSFFRSSADTKNEIYSLLSCVSVRLDLFSVRRYQPQSDDLAAKAEEALADARRAEALATSADDAILLASVRATVGEVLIELSGYEEARRLFDKVYAAIRPSERSLTAQTRAILQGMLRNRSIVLRRLRAFKESVDDLMELAAHQRENKDRFKLAETLCVVASIYREMYQLQQSRTVFDDAFEKCRDVEFGEPLKVAAETLRHRASLRRLLGDYKGAYEDLELSLSRYSGESWNRNGEERNGRRVRPIDFEVDSALRDACGIARHEGNYDSGLRYLARRMEFSQRSQNSVHEIRTYQQYAALFREQAYVENNVDILKEAKKFALSAIRLANDKKVHQGMIVELYTTLIPILRELSELDMAIDLCERGKEILKEMGEDNELRYVTLLNTEAATLIESSEHRHLAVNRLESAIGILTRFPQKTAKVNYAKATLFKTMADVHLRLREFAKGHVAVDIAIKLFNDAHEDDQLADVTFTKACLYREEGEDILGKNHTQRALSLARKSGRRQIIVKIERGCG